MNNKVVFAQNMKEVEVLLWHDGPLITHYRDQANDQDFVALWSDVDWTSKHDNTDYYFTFTVNPDDLADYVTNKITTRDLLKRARAIYECADVVKPEVKSSHGFRFDGFIDPDGVASGKPIKFDQIPKDLLPTDKSYLNPPSHATSSN